MSANDNPVRWADLGPRDRRRIRGAVADLSGAGVLEEAAATLSAKFEGCAEVDDYVDRMRAHAAELVENAHDSMTPDEFEAFQAGGA